MSEPAVLLANNGFSNFAKFGDSPKTSYTDLYLGCNELIYGESRSGEKTGYALFPFTLNFNWAEIIAGTQPIPQFPQLAINFGNVDPTKELEVILELWLNIGNMSTKAQFYYSEINANPNPILYPSPVSHAAVGEKETITLVFPTHGVKPEGQFGIRIYPLAGPNLSDFELNKITFRYIK